VDQQVAEQAYWKGYLKGEEEQAAKSTTDREQLADWWKAYDADVAERQAKWDAYLQSETEKNAKADAERDQFASNLALRLGPTCSWKGALNEPTAQLCAWWKGLSR
jgi:hypothetical protein